MSNFILAPDADILGRIVDAHWNYSTHGNSSGVEFRDIHQHDACNHTLSGTVDVDGTLYGFIIESGNNWGTVVHEWGLADDIGTYQPPPPPEPFTFVPADPNLPITRPGMFQVYLEWRKEEWFKAKEREYRYDRHFQPGGFVEKHYREWAAKKGMTIGLLSDFIAEGATPSNS